MIIDTHQHFWNIEEPWAKGVQDYRILAEPEGITGTILRLEENQEALDLADREPYIVGVSGRILPGPDFGAQLDKFSSNPLFRGICFWGSVLENMEEEKGMYLSCMEKLAAKDMPLDLLRVLPGFWGGPKALQKVNGSPATLKALFTIAESVPNLRIVIQHIGGMPIDGKPITQEWEDMFKRLARYPQIMIKVSGLMRGAVSRAQNERATELLAFYRPALDALWRIFGEDRLMYGSNWPVCEHEGDFIAQGLRIVRRYFSEKGQVAYDKYFWQNSIEAYKWSPRMTAQTFQRQLAQSSSSS